MFYILLYEYNSDGKEPINIISVVYMKNKTNNVMTKSILTLKILNGYFFIRYVSELNHNAQALFGTENPFRSLTAVSRV